MREIKYKALVVKTQLDNLGSNMQLAGVSEYEEMIKVQTISFDNGKVDYVTDEDMEEYSFADNSLKAVVEYTGLNDIKGKEIYEGDIVHTTGVTIDNRGVVKLIDGAWVVEAFDQKDGWFLFQEIEENEVIGNIYSNPGLLGEAI